MISDFIVYLHIVSHKQKTKNVMKGKTANSEIGGEIISMNSIELAPGGQKRNEATNQVIAKLENLKSQGIGFGFVVGDGKEKQKVTSCFKYVKLEKGEFATRKGENGKIYVTILEKNTRTGKRNKKNAETATAETATTETATAETATA